MLRAAESMAITALQLFEDEEKLKAVKDEFIEFRNANPYTCPIPKDVNPSTLK
jgi:aminobenzoyl-glutamate utilization protein B